MRKKLASGLLHLKEIFWRRVVVIVLAVYNGLQLIYNAVGWFLSPETQAKLQLVKVSQLMSWRTWLMGLLVIIIGILFEGSFRAKRKRESEHKEAIEKLEGKHKKATQKILSQLDLVRTELESEKAKAAAPEIKGSIDAAYLNTRPVFESDKIGCYVTIKVHLVNTSNADTTIRVFKLEAVIKGVPYESIRTTEGNLYERNKHTRQDIPIDNLITKLKESNGLSRGLGQDGYLRFYIEGVSPNQDGAYQRQGSDTEKIAPFFGIDDISSLRLTVVDEFERQYKIKSQNTKIEWGCVVSESESEAR